MKRLSGRSRLSAQDRGTCSCTNLVGVHFRRYSGLRGGVTLGLGKPVILAVVLTSRSINSILHLLLLTWPEIVECN